MQEIEIEEKPLIKYKLCGSRISSKVRHEQYDFRPETDTFFNISGYTGCDLCGEYNKYYSLIDPYGRDVSRISGINRQDVDFFINNVSLLCFDCSYDNGFDPIKRGEWSYEILDDDETAWPEPCEAGEKLIAKFSL